MGERRLKRVVVSAEVIGPMMTEGNVVMIERGLPKGAILLRAMHNPMTDSFDLIFEHESWEPVPEGAEFERLIPIIDIWLESIRYPSYE